MDSSLIMAFIDESPSFAHGFEIGQIWEKLKDGESFRGYACHSANREQIIKMCELFECNYTIEETSMEEWIYLTVAPTLVDE